MQRLLGGWAIGWGEGFFEWSSTDARGVVSMQLGVAEIQILPSFFEQATTSE